MTKRVLWTAVTVIILLLTGMVAKSDAADIPAGKVYLLVIDKLSIDDIDQTDTPNLYNLAQQGAIGLQSNRTLGSGRSEDGALTIGAGNLAEANNSRLMAYNVNTIVPWRNQNAGELYSNLTGNQVGKNAVVLTNLPELQQYLATESVSTRLGAMGEILRKNRQKVCVIGNGDINGEISRIAVGIAMDAHGRVALGDVGTRTERKIRDSYVTIQTNYYYIEENLPSLSKGARLVVIELSDLARLEKADQAEPSMAAAERKRLLYKIDQFVGTILPQVAEQDLLMTVTPSPSMAANDNKNTFTPLIIKGPGYRKGALYSPATRRDYIVANTDIAPTILQFLKLSVPNENMVGRAVTAVTGKDTNNLQTARQLGDETALVTRMRPPLVKGYVVIQILLIVLALLAVLAWPLLRSYVLPLLSTLLVIPLVFLLMPIIPLANEWQYALTAVFLTALFTWLSYVVCKKKAFKAFILLSVLTMLVLDIDILTGTQLIRASVLGYDPMSGARYYGIGNEYLGVLIGTCIIAGVALFRRLPRKWALPVLVLFFVIHTWLVGSPALGAQTDGVITVPLAFAVTLVLLANWKISVKTVLAIMIMIVVLVGGLAAYDMSRPPEVQTHIGRAANEIMSGGIGQAMTIIQRKASMNIKLIRNTIWSRVFMVILATLAVLLFWPAGAMLRIKERYPYLFKGFAGIMTGAVVGGIINDSGIVTAATTSIYLVTPILILIIKDNLIEPMANSNITSSQEYI